MAVIDYEDKPSKKSHGLMHIGVVLLLRKRLLIIVCLYEQSTLNLIQKRTKIYDANI